MVLYKYFRKVPSALPNPNSSPWGHMPLEAISSANRKILGLVHEDTVKNSKTITTTWGRYASSSTTKSLSSSKSQPKMWFAFYTEQAKLGLVQNPDPSLSMNIHQCTFAYHHSRYNETVRTSNQLHPKRSYSKMYISLHNNALSQPNHSTHQLQVLVCHFEIINCYKTTACIYAYNDDVANYLLLSQLQLMVLALCIFPHCLYLLNTRKKKTNISIFHTVLMSKNIL